ncbi:MAG: hypothetical protein P4L51_06015 [Puia sp.]|nr:hypothetical protein [Puia sp.]
MKAKSLFGVKFATDERYKTQVLDHYKSGKNKLSEAERNQFVKTATEKGMARGYSREAVEAALAIDESLDEMPMDFTEEEDLLKEDGCKRYYITQNVITHCKRLKTKEPFDLEWLQPVKDGKRQLNFGDSFIRYQKTGCRIVALSAMLTPRGDIGHLEYCFFTLDLAAKAQTECQVLTDEEDFEEGADSQEFDAASRKLFFQLITFMELAPVEEIFLPAGRKHGTRKSESCLLNETPYPMTIVTINWNMKIHLGKFDVPGHYKLQHWGPRNQLRKLIWREGYKTKGYRLNATKK